MFETARRILSTSTGPRRPPGRSTWRSTSQTRQLRFDPRGELGDQQPERHRAQHQLLCPAHEVERFAGHPLEPVDGVHDRLRARLDLAGLHLPEHERLGPAADQRHRPAEVVDQHAGHGAERGQAARSRSAPSGRRGSRTRALRERRSARRGARRRRSRARRFRGTGPSTSMPARPLRARSGTSISFAASGEVSTSCPSDSRKRVRGAAGPPAGGRCRRRRSALVELRASKPLEASVPEQQARALGRERLAQIDG